LGSTACGIRHIESEHALPTPPQAGGQNVAVEIAALCLGGDVNTAVHEKGGLVVLTAELGKLCEIQACRHVGKRYRPVGSIDSMQHSIVGPDEQSLVLVHIERRRVDDRSEG